MTKLRLTDGGLETSLIFHQGLELPDFAAFPLVLHDHGREALRSYWAPYLAFARESGAPFVVDTATWRASPDWVSRLGYDQGAVVDINHQAATLATELAAEVESSSVNGVVGPRGDGYVVGEVMSAAESAEYHLPQVSALADAGAGQVSAITFTYAQEAIGFVAAANAVGVPAVVSFTVETDGRLPSGATLRESIELVDAETAGGPRGYMINCAHPTHFEDVLTDGDWLGRITGIRANASTMSHAELDAAESLDDGDPDDLAQRYLRLVEILPALEVVGGCCGTDARHLRAIGNAVARQE